MVGHYGDLFVMKHDPPGQPEFNKENFAHRSGTVHSVLQGDRTGPPGTLQYQPNEPHWCEQKYGTVVHGREKERASEWFRSYG